MSNSLNQRDDTRIKDSKSNKSNNSNVKIFQSKNIFTLVTILSVVGTIFGGYLYFKSNLDTSNTDNNAKAASVSTGSGNVSVDKKYYVGGSEVDSTTIAKGSTVTVRLKYDNTSSASITNASIQDSLPQGFNFVSNSLKNCYVDTACVSLNNNLVSGQNLTVAPGAGYFGYASDNTLTSSNLEMGRKKNLYTYECAYTQNSNVAVGITGIMGNFTTALGGAGSVGTIVASSSDTFPGYACQSAVNINGVGGTYNIEPNAGPWLRKLDLTGKRYILLNQCMYTSSSLSYTNIATIGNYITFSGAPGNVGKIITSNDSTVGAGTPFSTECQAAITYNGTNYTRLQTDFYKPTDLLGNKNLHIAQCGYIPSNVNTRFTIAPMTNVSATNGTGTMQSNNNTSLSYTCDSSTSYNSLNYTLAGLYPRTIDLLDTTRAYGYIEYQMNAPSTITGNSQTFGTSTVLNGNFGNAGSASTLSDTFNTPSNNNVITVSNDTPVLSIDKKYVSSNGTESDTYTVTPGGNVKVRLRMNNTGDIAAKGVSVKDSFDTAKFDLIDGSVKSCLNPSYNPNQTTPDLSELICGNNIPNSTATTTLFSSSGLSPIAGLYDGNSTAANGGTASNASGGYLDVGKKRYLQHRQCVVLSQSQFSLVTNLGTTNNDVGFLYGNFNNNPEISTENVSFNCDSNFNYTPYIGLQAELLTGRYLQHRQCTIVSQPQEVYTSTIAVIKSSLGSFYGNLNVNPEIPAANVSFNCDTPNGFTPYLGIETDLLGKRAFHLYQCTITNNSAYMYTSKIEATNLANATSPYGCDTANGFIPHNTLSTSLLDPTRSSTFIEYELRAKSSAPNGSAGTVSSLNGAVQIETGASLNNGNAYTDGSNSSDLTISGSPISVDKKMAVVNIGSACPVDLNSYSDNVYNVIRETQEVCVRLVYRNNTAGMVSGSSISDSIDTTKLAYQAGSLKNCLAPEVGNAVCNTDAGQGGAFSTSDESTLLTGTTTKTLTIAPTAGLFGESKTSTNGIFEMGKWRYLNFQGCDYQNTTSFNTDDLVTFNPYNTPITGLNCSPALAGTTYRSANSTFSPVDILGKTFLNFQNCDYLDTANNNTDDVIGFNPSTVAQTALGCGTGPSGTTLRTANSVFTAANILGTRYLNYLNCDYQNNSTGNTDDTFNVSPSNTLAQGVSSCAAAPSGITLRTQNSVAYPLDLLHTPNSRGYIEYKVRAIGSVSSVNVDGSSVSGNDGNTTPTNYPTYVDSVTGTSQTGNSITFINQNEQFKVTKLLARASGGTSTTPGTGACPSDMSSYTSTLNNVVPGDQVCVRLRYQNLSTGAVSNASISDSIFSGTQNLGNITRLTTGTDAATKNCLTPESSSELCSDASGMGGAINNSGWDTNNQNFALTPHAGFYGIATNATTGSMEMGKKRYVNIPSCAYYSSGYTDWFVSILPSRTSTQSNIWWGQWPTASNNADTLNCSTISDGHYYLDQNGTTPLSKISNINIVGNRYINIANCHYYGTITDWLSTITSSPSGDYGQDPTASNVQTTLNCPNTPGSWVIDGGGTTLASKMVNLDTLGNRYLNLGNCVYYSIPYSDYHFRVNASLGYGQDPSASNNVDTLNCPAGSGSYSLDAGGTQPHSNRVSLDLLHTPNGYGYLQYKLQTPTNPSSGTVTLPSVTMTGTLVGETSPTTSTTNAVINYNSVPVTPDKVLGNGSCNPGSVALGNTTTCTFDLAAGNYLTTTDLKAKVAGPGTSTNTTSDYCTVDNSSSTPKLICTNVPTANLNSVGNLPVDVLHVPSTGTPLSPATNKATLTVTGINFAYIDTTFTPSENQLPLFRTNDTTTLTFTNFKSIFDNTPSSNTRYVCSLEYRKLEDRLGSTTTWNNIDNSITTPKPYNTSTGCSFNMTKALRANNLNYSFRLTIKDTTITNPTTTNPDTFLFYSEGFFRFQGAGVAAGN